MSKSKSKSKTHNKTYKNISPRQLEIDIVTAAEIAAHHYQYGKHKRKHSFGNTELNENFKRFLIIATIIIARSMVKQNPNSINYDIKNIQFNALNILTISSLLEFIEYLFGQKIKNQMVLGYTIVNILLGILN